MSRARPGERAARRELEPGATLERALDFAARWRELGGEPIELDDFSAGARCEPIGIVRLPAWAETVGAVLAHGGRRALIWAKPKAPVVKTSGSPFAPPSPSVCLLPAARGDGPFQLVIRQPMAWKRAPVLISYAGIAGQRFSGLERASGETLVLTLPARGESLILIAEMKHSGGD